MMRTLSRALWAVLSCLPSALQAASTAESYCQRLPFDDERPPGLPGRYELLGRESTHGALYSGRLTIDVGDDVYQLRRTVDDRETLGEAWLEACSPDRFPVLAVRYAGAATATHACFLRFDGNNDTRASCTAADGGLEAWFQMPRTVDREHRGP